MYFQALENGEAWSEPPSFLRVLTISRHPQSEKSSQYSMVRSEEVDRTRCVVFTATSPTHSIRFCDQVLPQLVFEGRLGACRLKCHQILRLVPGRPFLLDSHDNLAQVARPSQVLKDELTFFRLGVSGQLQHGTITLEPPSCDRLTRHALLGCILAGSPLGGTART